MFAEIFLQILNKNVGVNHIVHINYQNPPDEIKTGRNYGYLYGYLVIVIVITAE